MKIAIANLIAVVIHNVFLILCVIAKQPLPIWTASYFVIITVSWAVMNIFKERGERRRNKLHNKGRAK